MRYVAAALIATLGSGACTEPAHRALGPAGDVNGRDGTPIQADTILDCLPRSCPAPTLISRSNPRLPKSPGPHAGPGTVVMSFVIDTSGFVIPNSVRIEKGTGAYGDAFRDWLREARFEPVRRDGRPLRAAFRNLQVVFRFPE
jgi:hypothetical protein